MALRDDPKVQALVARARAEAHTVALGIVNELKRVHASSATIAGDKAAATRIREFASSLTDQVKAARDDAKDEARAAKDAAREAS